MMSVHYDAIVVGSGISGGWAAKELTEKGLRVLLLERGRNVEHVKDYVNATKGPWEYLHRGGRTYAMEQAYPVLKRDYPLNEKNLAFWVNEKDSPYTEVKRFDWYRGYQVGGRSLTWGRQNGMPGFPAHATACRSFRTGNFCRRCRSTAARNSLPGG